MTDIEYTKQIIENSKLIHTNYNPMYLFTNENLNNLLKKINLEGKDIFTVCSSSDQYFNFLLNGANNIATFDINKLTEYLFYLKRSAIINLDYEEFKTYLLKEKINNKFIFSKEIYNQIKDDLPDNIKYYWNELYRNYTGKEIYKSRLFIDNKKQTKTIKNNNQYLKTEQNYNKLKNILKHVKTFNYNNINIFNEIPNNIKYDFIYLSNIFDCLNATNQEEFNQKAIKIINILAHLLKEEGEIAIQYIFVYMEKYWNNINKDISKLIAYNMLDNLNGTFKIIEVPSGLTYNSKKPEDKDAVILYKKKSLEKK